MKSFCRGFSFGILYRYLPYISTVYLTDIVLNQVLFQDNNNPIILCPVSLYQAELLLRDRLWHKQDNAADIISEMLGWDAAGGSTVEHSGSPGGQGTPAPPHTWGHRLQGTRHTYHQPHISHFYGMEGWGQLTISNQKLHCGSPKMNISLSFFKILCKSIDWGSVELSNIFQACIGV